MLAAKLLARGLPRALKIHAVTGEVSLALVLHLKCGLWGKVGVERDPWAHCPRQRALSGLLGMGLPLTGLQFDCFVLCGQESGGGRGLGCSKWAISTLALPAGGPDPQNLLGFCPSLTTPRAAVWTQFPGLRCSEWKWERRVWRPCLLHSPVYPTAPQCSPQAGKEKAEAENQDPAFLG